MERQNESRAMTSGGGEDGRKEVAEKDDFERNREIENIIDTN